MKKFSMIISGALAVSMAVPAISNAANKYPSNPGYVSGIASTVLSEEEYEEYVKGWRQFEEELVIGYQNGEYDWDFNLDGEVTAVDGLFLMERYAEKSVGVLQTEVFDYLSSDEDDWRFWDYTDEMREKIDAEGDINGDGRVDASDVSWMMFAYYSSEKQGDVDTDGYVDANDASALLAYYSAMSIGKTADYVTTKNMEYLGDVNGDGKIDAADASAVLEEYSANSVSD